MINRDNIELYFIVLEEFHALSTDRTMSKSKFSGLIAIFPDLNNSGATLDTCTEAPTLVNYDKVFSYVNTYADSHYKELENDVKSTMEELAEVLEHHNHREEEIYAALGILSTEKANINDFALAMDTNKELVIQYDGAFVNVLDIPIANLDFNKITLLNGLSNNGSDAPVATDANANVLSLIASLDHHGFETDVVISATSAATLDSINTLRTMITLAMNPELVVRLNKLLELNKIVAKNIRDIKSKVDSCEETYSIIKYINNDYDKVVAPLSHDEFIKSILKAFKLYIASISKLVKLLERF